MTKPTPLQVSTTLPPRAPRRIVLLHPGIFATPAFFAPLIPFLLERGCAVVHFDPRGLGANRDEAQGEIDTSVRVEDLLDVARGALAELPQVPVAFLGHSFGGFVIYAALLRASRTATVEPWFERVDECITLASPSHLVADREPPWQRLFSEHSQQIVAGYRQAGWIEFAEFVLAQKEISKRLRDRVPVPASLVRFSLARARRSSAWARITLNAPLPSTFLYAPGDFTPRSFRDFLSSGAMDRDSTAVVRELIDSGVGGQLRFDDVEVRPALAEVPIGKTTIASPWDELVTPAEAAVPGATNVLLEGAARCGHAGYLYREASLAQVLKTVGERLG